MATRAGSSKDGFMVHISETGKLVNVPSDDRAVDLAIQMARRRTKRRKVFAVFPVDSFGKTEGSSQVTPLYTNRVSDFCRALAASDSRIAAVLVTPDDRDLMHKAFLREIRELTSAEGAWLIWKETKVELDETHAIPREFFGIRPDITCWKKARRNA